MLKVEQLRSAIAHAVDARNKLSEIRSLLRGGRVVQDVEEVSEKLDKCLCSLVEVRDAKDTSTEQAPVARQFGHYFKDVRHLHGLDVYRVLSLFEVTDPALQHAVKKLLCTGKRGAKDQETDLKEAIASVERALEMRKEDAQ